MRRVCLLGVLLWGLVGHASAQPLPSLVHGIPDLCAAPTVSTTKAGAWSDPTVWTRVPTAGDRVRVAHAVTYDTRSDVELECVGVSGVLAFAHTRDTRLTVGTLLVYETGRLELGTTAGPIPAARRAEIVIADRPLDLARDPEQFGTGLIALGTVRMHGAIKTAFVRAATEPMAGSPMLTLASAPTGWRSGDTLLIPDTRQLRYNENSINGGTYVPQWETPLVTSLPTATSVRTAGPLQFNHLGARATLTGNLEYLPHVGNLSRSVVLRSANPSGTRGHVIFVHRADVDIRYVEFNDLGRTTTRPLDSTTFANGQVTHVGTNQIGRYPLHVHHVAGPIIPQPNGRQFTLIGNTISRTPKWAVSIHNSHFGLIADNVVFDSGGAGYVTEDGSETQNVFERNLVVGSFGEGGRQGGGREGGGFWFRGADNVVRDNVAANVLSNSPDAAYGYKYFLEHLGDVRVPKFPGADTTDNGQVNIVSSHAIPVREFVRNEVYGATESGLTYWWIGSRDVYPVANMQESVFRDTVMWNIHNKAVFHYPASKITIDGLIVRSTNPGGDSACCQLGVDYGDYYGKDLILRNLDIQGRLAGITGSPILDNTALVVDNALLNVQKAIEIPSMWSVNASAEIFKNRTYVLRNVKHVPPPGGKWPGLHLESAGSVVLKYSEDGVKAPVLLDAIYVYDWNQTPGDSFRVYYQEQRPDYIVPVTQYNSDGTRRVIGAPAAGKSNAQNWTQHQVAIAGAVAPCTSTRPNFLGAFVCPVSTPPRRPLPPTDLHLIP